MRDVGELIEERRALLAFVLEVRDKHAHGAHVHATTATLPSSGARITLGPFLSTLRPPQPPPNNPQSYAHTGGRVLLPIGMRAPEPWLYDACDVRALLAALRGAPSAAAGHGAPTTHQHCPPPTVELVNYCTAASTTAGSGTATPTSIGARGRGGFRARGGGVVGAGGAGSEAEDGDGDGSGHADGDEQEEEDDDDAEDEDELPGWSAAHRLASSAAAFSFPRLPAQGAADGDDEAAAAADPSFRDRPPRLALPQLRAPPPGPAADPPEPNVGHRHPHHRHHHHHHHDHHHQALDGPKLRNLAYLVVAACAGEDGGGAAAPAPATARAMAVARPALGVDAARAAEAEHLLSIARQALERLGAQRERRQRRQRKSGGGKDGGGGDENDDENDDDEDDDDYLVGDDDDQPPEDGQPQLLREGLPQPPPGLVTPAWTATLELPALLLSSVLPRDFGAGRFRSFVRWRDTLAATLLSALAQAVRDGWVGERAWKRGGAAAAEGGGAPAAAAAAESGDNNNATPTPTTTEPTAQQLMARLKAALRRGDVRDADDFDFADYRAAARSAASAARALAARVDTGCALPWALRVRVALALLRGVFSPGAPSSSAGGLAVGPSSDAASRQRGLFAGFGGGGAASSPHHHPHHPSTTLLYAEGHEDYLRLLRRRVWPLLGLSPLAQDACLAWVHLRRFAATREPALVPTARALLERVAAGAAEASAAAAAAASSSSSNPPPPPFSSSNDAALVRAVCSGAVAWVAERAADYHARGPALGGPRVVAALIRLAGAAQRAAALASPAEGGGGAASGGGDDDALEHARDMVVAAVQSSTDREFSRRLAAAMQQQQQQQRAAGGGSGGGTSAVVGANPFLSPRGAAEEAAASPGSAAANAVLSAVQIARALAAEASAKWCPGFEEEVGLAAGGEAEAPGSRRASLAGSSALPTTTASLGLAQSSSMAVTDLTTLAEGPLTSGALREPSFGFSAIVARASGGSRAASGALPLPSASSPRQQDPAASSSPALLPEASALAHARLHARVGALLLPWLHSLGASAAAVAAGTPTAASAAPPATDHGCLDEPTLAAVRAAADVEPLLLAAPRAAAPRCAHAGCRAALLGLPPPPPEAGSGNNTPPPPSSSATPPTWELAAHLQPALAGWVAAQARGLDTWVARQLETEAWRPLGQGQPHASSARETRRLLLESLDALFAMAVPLPAPVVAAHLEGAQAALSRYARFVRASLGPAARLVPPKPALVRYKREVAAKQEEAERRLLRALAPALGGGWPPRGGRLPPREMCTFECVSSSRAGGGGGGGGGGLLPSPLKHGRGGGGGGGGSGGGGAGESSLLSSPRGSGGVPGAGVFLLSVPRVEDDPAAASVSQLTAERAAVMLASLHYLLGALGSIGDAVAAKWRRAEEEGAALNGGGRGSGGGAGGGGSGGKAVAAGGGRQDNPFLAGGGAGDDDEDDEEEQEEEQEGAFFAPVLPSARGAAAPSSTSGPASLLAAGGDHALEAAAQELRAASTATARWLACRLVWWDGRALWCEQLWRHRAAECRADTVGLLDLLAQALALYAAPLEPEEARKGAAAAVLRESAAAAERALLDGGAARWFVAADAADALAEDLDRLEALFHAEGDGLPLDECREALAGARGVVALMALDTQALVTMHQRAAAAGGGGGGAAAAKAAGLSGAAAAAAGDAPTLLRVLAHRADHSASKYLKDAARLPKAREETLGEMASRLVGLGKG